MREIKFRIPHYNFKGEFVTFSYWGRLEDCEFASPAMISNGPIKKPDEQYTGLKDKNGKEIYEGDILHDGKGEDMTVRYNENTAMFMCFVDNESWYLNEGDPNRSCQLQYTEIIGNIHENKDLLK